MTEWKTKTVPLAHPITVGERSYTSLTLTELDADGLEAIEDLGFSETQNPTVKQLKGAIAVVTRTDVSIIGKLHKEDFTTIGEECVPFIGGTPEPSPEENPANTSDAKTSTPFAATSPTG